MSLTQKISLLFPTPVAKIQFKELDVISLAAKSIVDNLTTFNYEQLEYANVCTSSDNLHTLPEFQNLLKIIDREAQLFFNDYLGLDSNKVKMTCMWSNIQKDTCRHNTHQHPNSFYSGVVYLNIPTGDNVDPGNIFFIDPRYSKNMMYAEYTKQNPLSDREWWFNPVTGMMLLFPSWLEHGTKLCRIPPDQYRISLSFNYIITSCSTPTMRFNID
jgi:uncharacterized protein (TIGR02466 family)